LNFSAGLFCFSPGILLNFFPSKASGLFFRITPVNTKTYQNYALNPLKTAINEKKGIYFSFLRIKSANLSFLHRIAENTAVVC
jgi:hypothetical protein